MDANEKVYVLFSVDADSWFGGSRFLGVYKTLEDAVADVPENVLQYERKPYGGNVVKDYAYRIIREVPLYG